MVVDPEKSLEDSKTPRKAWTKIETATIERKSLPLAHQLHESSSEEFSSPLHVAKALL